MKTQAKIAIAFFICVGILIFIIYFHTELQTPTTQRVTSQTTLACDPHPYTTPFITSSLIQEITPLGNTHPPEHTLPTNHVYIHVSAQNTEETTYPLVAPGRIHVHLIRSSVSTLDPEDYSIRYSVCDTVHGYFNHVKTLSETLRTVALARGCTLQPPEECVLDPPYTIEAGEALGSVGGAQGNFDFGTLDLTQEHPFANPYRYSDVTRYIQCGLDYYEPIVREQLTQYYPQSSQGSCGTNAYDKSGTIQGNWFNGDATEWNPQTWDQHLFIGYDNVDPTLGVISVGGTFMERTKWLFEPRPVLRIQRAPDTTHTNAVYCYDRTTDAEAHRDIGLENGKILFELIDDTTLHAQYKEGTCSQNEEIDDPTEYRR